MQERRINYTRRLFYIQIPFSVPSNHQPTNRDVEEEEDAVVSDV